MNHFFTALLSTLRDLAPIVGFVLGFQLLVLRRPLPNPRQIALGIGYVALGLTLFLMGLEQALFPIGRLMAQQLTDPAFLQSGAQTALHWSDYGWVYLFAATIGFSTTIAEPALLSVALKARELSGGALPAWALRATVAVGVAVGIALGSWRIVTGYPLYWFIIGGYIVVLIQTLFAPRMIIALAYDSGGVTTSTVTVPLVTALGLGLASSVPGRSALLDGFGLIAFASLFPIMAVLGYAQIVQWRARRGASKSEE